MGIADSTPNQVLVQQRRPVQQCGFPLTQTYRWCSLPSPSRIDRGASRLALTSARAPNSGNDMRISSIATFGRGLGLIIVLLLGLASLIGSGGGGDDPPDPPYEPRQGTYTLSIAPIAQQTEVWCWAAAAEMVFRHYGLPALNTNYQCGIVAAYFGPNSFCWQNCFACVSAIGPMSQMHVLVNGYGPFVNQFTPSRVLSSSLVFSPLSFSDTAREIDSARPVLAGISPTGYAYPNISQHIVTIVGYQNTSGGTQVIIINDPFPYDLFPTNPNPYTLAGASRTRPGQYAVPYAAAVSRLQWANTIYQIR